jgi:hypothetical protein
LWKFTMSTLMKCESERAKDILMAPTIAEMPPCPQLLASNLAQIYLYPTRLQSVIDEEGISHKIIRFGPTYLSARSLGRGNGSLWKRYHRSPFCFA